MHKDAHAYDGMLWVAESHLIAARTATVGLFLANPITHSFPPMDDLTDKFDILISEIQSARKKAAQMRNQTNDR